MQKLPPLNFVGFQFQPWFQTGFIFSELFACVSLQMNLYNKKYYYS